MTTPGWYPDPYGTSPLRYWDGAIWTGYVSVGAQPPPSSAPYIMNLPITPPWYKRKVTLVASSAVAVLVILGVIGAATGSPKTKNASTTTIAGPSSSTSQGAPLVQSTQATMSSAAPVTTSQSPAPPIVATTSVPPAAPVPVAQTTTPVKITTPAPKPPAQVASAAPPAPVQQTFANCTAMNQVYPHGIGRAGAVDHVSGSSKPVTTFYVDTALYNANASHDGDGDGIACEKN